jgi:hypothetical protein
MSALETIKEKEAKTSKRRSLLDLTSEKLASLTLVGTIKIFMRTGATTSPLISRNLHEP